MYKENLSHSDPMAYIESKYCDVTSPNFCSYMTEDQRSIAYRNEKRMLQTGGKYSAGFARYDYALRNYKDVYTGGSRSVGYVRNTDREKQYARSVVNQQISNLGQRRTNILYGMKCMRQQGMMHAMRHIEMVLLLQRMAQIYLPCLRQRLKMAQGMNFILIDGWNMLRMAGKKKMI